MKGLGDRIQSLRKLRGITLVELAKTTGIDQATLSRIENGKMTGTLDSHTRIAQALGIRLPQLYEEVLNKFDEAKEKALRQKIEAFSHSGGAVSQILTTNVLQKKIMPILLKIKGLGLTENEEYIAGAERFVYLVKGAIEVSVNKDKKILKPGESLYFNAALPHHFRNPLKLECQCLSVMTPAAL